MPTGWPCGLEERVGHGAADEERVDLAEQVLDDLELVRDLGAAEDRDERPFGALERLAEVVDLGRHQEAGGRLLDVVDDALGRGVRAVRRSERVVDVDVGERRQLRREGRVVGLFLGVEPQVFEEDHAARMRGDGGRGVRADAVGGKRDGPAEQPGQVVGDRLQAVLGIGLALRTSEVRREDDRGALFERVADGRQRRADPRVVGDRAVARSGR